VFVDETQKLPNPSNTQSAPHKSRPHVDRQNLPTAVAVLSSFPEFSDFSLPKLADFYFQSWLVFISKVGYQNQEKKSR